MSRPNPILSHDIHSLDKRLPAEVLPQSSFVSAPASSSAFTASLSPLDAATSDRLRGMGRAAAKTIIKDGWWKIPVFLPNA
jgi:hypothetical protein